jgi:hypothetical protein
VGLNLIREIDSRGISTADKNRDALSRRWSVAPRVQSCERSGPARLCDDAQRLPKCGLRRPYVIVTDENDVGRNEGAGYRIIESADTLRSQTVGGDAATWRINWVTGRECGIQCRCPIRLDANDLDAARKPGGDARDQTPTPNRDQQRVDVRCVRFEFEPDGTLTEQRLQRWVSIE